MRLLLPLLVRLFPREFRRQFGEDLVAQIRADYDRVCVRGGNRGFCYGLLIGLDLLRSAMAERLNPAWASPPAASSQRKELRWAMNGLMEDLRHSIRTLRRSPGFATVTVGTLGLAIGANAGIFSVVDTVLKTRRAETIAPEVRTLVREVAPEAPMYRVFTMAGLAADSMVRLSFTLLTLGITSLLALILGAVGLYGVLSNVVAERRREIGVRMALGAEAGRVWRMVVTQGTRVVVLGVVIGIAVAIWTTRALGSLLFGVGALDFATFLAMAATMVLIGMLAGYMPAHRASSVDPMESLRAD